PVDPLTVTPEEEAVIERTFATGMPTLVIDAARQAPRLASRVGMPALMLLPLADATHRVGLLVVGFEQPPKPSDTALSEAMEVSDAFLTALELFRLRQAEELRQDLRDLTREFCESLAATLNLAAGLENFCDRANRLFGADRTSVWIHDRKARHLLLRGSSDPRDVAPGVRISTDDPLSPAASAMRTRHAKIFLSGDSGGPTLTVTVPLRGTRRALGTIVFDSVRVETGGELDLLNRADELGRELSSAIENMQLLDDLLRSRRE